MQIELHRKNVYQGVELLLLVYMLFLLAIPKCLLIFKGNFYYSMRLTSFQFPEFSPFWDRDWDMSYSDLQRMYSKDTQGINCLSEI